MRRATDWYFVSMLVSLLTCGSGVALAEEPARATGQDCASIEKDAERLACYDRLFRGSTEHFGSKKVPKAAEEPSELRAHVTEVKRLRDGKYVLTLDNGQVWAQKEVDNTVFDPGDEIVIRRGSFNSYRIGPAGGKSLTLATRIK
jgi:hypothetical protein